MSDKLITIIIPTLNEEENLSELLPYLKKNMSASMEIIVADAYKTDDQTTKICEQNQVKRVVCDKCSRATQMNLGAQEAKGDILYFVHADTRPPASFEQGIRETLSGIYDFGIFSYKFDSDSKLLAINAKFTKRKGIFSGGGDQSIFMRKETFQSLDMFDTNYCIMEDFKLFHKAKTMKMKYRVIPHDVLVSARKYEKNSYLRVNFSNFIAFSMYHLGMKPEKIKKAYSYLLK